MDRRHLSHFDLTRTQVRALRECLFRLVFITPRKKYTSKTTSREDGAVYITVIKSNKRKMAWESGVRKHFKCRLLRCGPTKKCTSESRSTEY